MMQHPHLLLGAILAVLCSTLSTVIAAPPTLVYPLQAQRPPVARAGSNWTFALHEGTFSAAGSANATIVHLSLASTLPSWCTFDEATRTFYGTPGKGDLGSTIVSVNAAAAGDGDGATTTTQGSFTLLVVDPKTDPTPTVQLPLAQQLASAAAVSGGGTLTPDGSLKVPPKWSFSFGFEWYTISSSAGDSMFWTAYQKGRRRCRAGSRSTTRP